MENAQQTNKRTVAEQLREAGECASRGMVQEALDIIAGLRKLYPKNIYVIGLRKQIQKLLTSPDSDTRRDILASFPQLTERAILEATVSDRLEKNRSVQIEETQARSRAAALDRLKAQYLGHAERYFQRGEHEKALIEVRRIQIISPGDDQVDAFEKKLMRLIENPNAPTDVLFQRNEGPASSRTMEELMSKRPGPWELEAESSSSRGIGAQVGPKPAGTTTRAIASTVSKGTRIVRWAVIIAVLLIIAAVIFFTLRTESQGGLSGALNADSLAHKFAETKKPTFEEQAATDPTPSSQEVSQPSQESDQQPSPEKEPVAVAQEPEPQRSSPMIVRDDPPPAAVTPEVVRKNTTVAAPKAEEPAPVAAQPTVTPHDTTGFAALRFASETLPKPPRIMQLSAPAYPDSALAANLSGQVMVFVQLDMLGHPLVAKIYKSSHHIFEGPAQQAALRSAYTPGATETGTVSSWIVVPFLFRPNRPSVSATE